MDYEIKPVLREVLNKIAKKDNALYERILKKIEEVVNSNDRIEHYKNLRYNLKEYKRVHIGHFVLIFKVNEDNNLVSFEDFQHHDFIY